MRQYTVTGMTCAACQSHVEKAVAEVPGVSSVAVALLTNSMAVDGTASDEEIIRAVENAGYGARLKGEEKKKSSASEKLAQEAEALADHETPKLKRRPEIIHAPLSFSGARSSTRCATAGMLSFCRKVV